jgi:predicted ester cyclase
MVGCQDKAAMAELEKFKTQAAVEEQNKALVHNYFKEMDSSNFDFVMNSFASDAKIFFPSSSQTPMPMDEVLLGLKSFYEAFPDYKHDLKEIIAEGDIVIVRTIDSGTHEGEFMGIPATGNRFEVGAVVILRINNGKIVELWEEIDNMGLM